LGGASVLLAIVFAGAFASRPATAQTTNDWLLPGGGLWTNDANWVSGAVPDSDTEVANFTNDFAANFNVTQNVSLTINGIIFSDTGADPDAVLSVVRTGSEVLTFGGANPFIDSRSGTAGGAGINFNLPIDIGAGGVTKVGGGVANLASTLTGSGALTISNGTVEIRGNNTNFTGEIVVNNGAAIEPRSGTANSFGTTNAGITFNGTGRTRLRDINNITFNEPVTINGVNVSGTIQAYAFSNVTFNGPVLLNTNGVISLRQFSDPNAGGAKRDFFVNSVISDDGNGRGVHFIHDASGSAATGLLTRASEIVLGGVSTYGGYTHITANRGPDALGLYAGNVRLTNGSDRLPTVTTVILGGFTNGVGTVSGVGRLALAGYDQEVAGLIALGTGVSNRVVGGSTALSTLTLNIGAGTNNVFGGFLGGPGANDNNLALLSKGSGVLDLTGANTYTGTTTVTNGTLRVNGSHVGGGSYSILNGGVLGGTGLIDAAVQVAAGGTVAPGNYIGTLTISNSFDLDGTLQIELQNGAGPGGASDLLDVNGFFDITNGTLQWIFSETLTNDFYVFAEYDTFSGGPFLDAGVLPGGYMIDYTFGANNNQIALVIPEPSTFALLTLGVALAFGLCGSRIRRRG